MESRAKAKGHGISLLVPLNITDPNGQRAKNWQWLQKYWKANLPGAEIVIGEDCDASEKPFSKSVAVNNAAAKAKGDVFAIIDADAYISVQALIRCAEEIRNAENNGYCLWYVPYRKLYRLTEEVSSTFLASDPKILTEFKPSPGDFSNVGMFEDIPITQIGHWYGAMAQIMSRGAFYTVGGWDTRFEGWGGEDHAAMVAMDTLYGPHKTLPYDIMHLWHPVLVPDEQDDPRGKKRLWANQDSKKNNDVLSGRYYWSKGHPKRMRRLVDEFLRGEPNREFSCTRPVPYDPSV